MVLLIFLVSIIIIGALSVEKTSPKSVAIAIDKTKTTIYQFTCGTNTTVTLPSYYAEENGIYYNPDKNMIKLAAPRTRLQTLNKLGYTEYIGSLWE